jgi:hypothetical protein
MIVIYFSEEKKRETYLFFLMQYCSFTTAVLFKIDFLVELGINLLFLESKRRSEQA